jgi:hypothetical protein
MERRYSGMPTSPKPPKTQSAPAQFKQSKFINYDLLKEEKEQLKLWKAFQDKLQDMLETVCEAGYDVTIKRDSFSGGYAAWLRPNKDDHPHSGFILAGRGSTGVRALRDVLFKHFVLFDQENWPIFEVTGFDDDF